jgi:plastocyanin domain-containing protein
MKSIVITILVGLSTSVFGASIKNSETQIIHISVTEKGFEPSMIHVATEKSVILKITRQTDTTCATSISIPAKKIKVGLPLNKTVDVKLGHLKKGEIHFACGVGMIGGEIFVQ